MISGGFKRSSKGYPKYMKELLDIFYEAGIWRKMSWEDFLTDLCKIMAQCEESEVYKNIHKSNPQLTLDL
jgi:hypothetical protein